MSNWYVLRAAALLLKSDTCGGPQTKGLKLQKSGNTVFSKNSYIGLLDFLANWCWKSRNGHLSLLIFRVSFEFYRSSYCKCLYESYIVNRMKRRNPPCAAPPLSSFPMGKKLDTTQRGASQGVFLLFILFIGSIWPLSIFKKLARWHPMQKKLFKILVSQ